MPEREIGKRLATNPHSRNARHIGAALGSFLDGYAPKVGPLISIVVPAYNDETFVARALKSCLAQTYDNIEVVCVDDASTDATLLVLEKIAQGDGKQRVKVISLEENSGPHNARRIGVAAAKGEIVCFLDSDDELGRTACAKMSSEYARSPVDILHFSSRVYRDGYATVEQALDVADWTTPVEGELFGREIAVRSFVEQEYSFSIWGKAYRADIARRAFEALGERESDFGEDALEYFAIAYFSSTYRGLPNARLYGYHLGDGLSARRDMTADEFGRTLRGIRSIEGMRAFLEGQGAFDEYADVYHAHRSGQLNALLKSWWRDVRVQDRAEVLARILELWPLEEVVDGVCALGTPAVKLLCDCLGEEVSFTSDQLYRRGVADGAASSQAEYESSASYRAGRILTAIPRRLRATVRK